MYNYNHENKYHKCIGFAEIEGEVKPVYFDKEKRAYKVLVTSMKKIKDKSTKEEILIFNGMDWKYLDENEIKVVE